ncbi:hypothetical protein EVAR_60589_1 [Eumeta japonica]|uniref:Uncharacterized protein n=1 Tax=Eumeta variegata TaxID=151549 RepID=A0A4C1YIH6_EUMVA|nr:hypothetical protein EVAR_60589_1 [Eumeta japonica]
MEFLKRLLENSNPAPFDSKTAPSTTGADKVGDILIELTFLELSQGISSIGRVSPIAKRPSKYQQVHDAIGEPARADRNRPARAPISSPPVSRRPAQAADSPRYKYAQTAARTCLNLSLRRTRKH